MIGLDYDQDQSQSLIQQEPMREELPSWFGQSRVEDIVGRQDLGESHIFEYFQWNKGRNVCESNL